MSHPWQGRVEEGDGAPLKLVRACTDGQVLPEPAAGRPQVARLPSRLSGPSRSLPPPLRAALLICLLLSILCRLPVSTPRDCLAHDGVRPQSSPGIALLPGPTFQGSLGSPGPIS